MQGEVGLRRMKKAPFKCLFCVASRGPFTRVEHPIPESLGNDDLVLPVGYVCDGCNQYFGSKLERAVLSSPPFNVERVAGAIKTKKGRLPKHLESGLEIHSTGHWDQVVLAGNAEKVEDVLKKNVLWSYPPPKYADLLARFFLKIGLESLSRSFLCF
jgi:HNH endonuclease